MTSDLFIHVEDGVALLTLNRPDRRNAYTRDMGRLLSGAYRDCDADDTVRAIVITGAGDSFCVGADFDSATDPFGAAEVDFTSSPIDPPAYELRKPVIAAVNGHAIGIGLTIALQTDIRILATGAKYAVPQVRRGVIGDCAAHWTLARVAGIAAASEVLLTGRTLTAEEALAIGLASRVADPGAVLAEAIRIARDIAVNVAPMSAALSKRLLWDTAQYGYTPREVADLETQLHHRVMGKPDAAEGVAAFLQRRPPNWSASVSREWTDLPRPQRGGG